MLLVSFVGPVGYHSLVGGQRLWKESRSGPIVGANGQTEDEEVYTWIS